MGHIAFTWGTIAPSNRNFNVPNMVDYIALDRDLSMGDMRIFIYAK